MKEVQTMIEKLIEKIKATQAPIVVGLDPMLEMIPGKIKRAAFEGHGETLEGAAEAIWFRQLNRRLRCMSSLGFRGLLPFIRQ